MKSVVRQNKRGGFTLIELSIVLVIIGLVVGGILTARDLIRASELQSVISDSQRFTSAVNTFKTKYNAVPGDMANAEAIWGSDASCPNTPANTVRKTATCNGNGNGKIASTIPSTSWYEIQRAWQQLANAGLIESQYSGTGTSTNGTSALLGIGVPASKIKNGGYEMYYLDVGGISTYDKANRYSHVLDFAGVSASNQYTQPILTSIEAMGIDAKIDDGAPGRGKVVVLNMLYGIAAGCAVTLTNPDTTYDTTSSGLTCALQFTRLF